MKLRILAAGFSIPLLIAPVHGYAADFVFESSTRSIRLLDGTHAEVQSGTYDLFHTAEGSEVRFKDGTFGSVYSSYGGSLVFSGGSAHVVGADTNGTARFEGGTAHVAFGQLGGHMSITGGIISEIRSSDGLVDISGGLIGEINVYDRSVINITGGTSLNRLEAVNHASVIISGGSIPGVRLIGENDVRIVGRDFTISSGLTVNAYKVMGTGALSGKWNDGTPFSMGINTEFGGAVTLMPAFGSVSTFSPANEFREIELNASQSLIDTSNVGRFVLTENASAQIPEGARISSSTATDNAFVRNAGGLLGPTSLSGAAQFEQIDGLTAGIGASENAKITVAGGVASFLQVQDQASALITGGTAGDVSVGGDARVLVQGGSVGRIHSFRSGYIEVTGGSVGMLTVDEGARALIVSGVAALDVGWSGYADIIATDYQFGEGLWRENDQLFGTGLLTGRWSDGTQFEMMIYRSDPGGTIHLLPEPGTLSALWLGLACCGRRTRRNR